jgi:hypothetical protein
MSDNAKTNWAELSEQVADRQVKAFLRVIFEMGAVLDKKGHPIRDGSSTLGGQTLGDRESTEKTREM